MTKDQKDETLKDDEAKVVDELLAELGVDDQMKRELVDSGRISRDILKVESADQVKRRIEIEKSIDRLRDSMRVIEREIIDFETSVDKIERDLIPVVLSFLVSLKGNLVNMRTTIVGRAKRRAKTNLQATYVETEVKEIVDEEFAAVEDTLTSGMSAPIMEKIKELTEGMKGDVKSAIEGLTTLKGSLDDYSQKSITELEFISKELSMKPKVEIPKEVADKVKTLERQVEELTRDLQTTEQKLKNREEQTGTLQTTLAELKARNESLEDTIAQLRSSPVVDREELAELRQSVKAIEASREVIKERLDAETKRADDAEEKIRELGGSLSKKDLEIQDLLGQNKQLQQDIESIQSRLGELDELRARIRSYESGDKMRELERLKTEYDRASASFDRLTKDFEATKARMETAEFTAAGYISLMQNTEKTKAYLMIEDSTEISIREIAKSLGISPAIAIKWAEDFVRLGIAEMIEDDKIRALTKRTWQPKV